MTKVKKMLGMVMAALMCFALTPAAAFAASGNSINGAAGYTTGSITITNATVGQEYKAYEIFQLESWNGDAYSYKVTNDWKGFFAEGQGGAAFATIDNQGYVTWTQKAENGNAIGGAEFAEAAKAYIAANSTVNATSTITAGEGMTDVKNGDEVNITFTGLQLGYYFVTSTVGTVCALDTTNPNMSVQDKNEKPSNVKQVQEDSNNAWGSANHADVGQTVSYKSTITGQAGAVRYKLHDTMTTGLTFNNDVKVTFNGTTLNTPADYTVTSAPAGAYLADGCTFEVEFTDSFCQKIAADNEIVVSYSATVNQDAVTADVMENTSKLTYGNGTNVNTTPDSTTKTYTGGFEVFKRNGDNQSEGLAGAIFEVRNSSGDLMKVVKISEENAEIPVYRPVVGDEAGITQIETVASGKFQIKGLDADTYTVKEVKAPNGFNQLSEDKTVVVPETTTEGVITGVGFGDLKIDNYSGIQLPSTGGMGTTILYIVGGVLVVAAIAFIAVRRRNAAR